MKTKKLVVSAMLLAVAAVLSLIKVFELPFGGGVTLVSMMPIILVSYLYGTKQGLLTALVYSVIQILIGFNTVSRFFLPGDEQMTVINALLVCFIDYIVAYTLLGLGGVFKGKMKNNVPEIICGSIVALFARYIAHIVSGAIFFGMWAEWFFTQEGFYKIGDKIMNTFSGTGLSVIYSIFYNGLYMIPEIILTAIVTPIVYKAIKAAKLV